MYSSVKETRTETDRGWQRYRETRRLCWDPGVLFLGGSHPPPPPPPWPHFHSFCSLASLHIFQALLVGLAPWGLLSATPSSGIICLLDPFHPLGSPPIHSLPPGYRAWGTASSKEHSGTCWPSRVNPPPKLLKIMFYYCVGPKMETLLMTFSST